MLIIPEVQTIFVFPPRTASNTFCQELISAFPRSFLLYRHMEADGVPEGFERYRKVGFMRHPLSRLWSLFKFCSMINEEEVAKIFPAEAARVSKSVEGLSFESWVLNNKELFMPKDTGIPYLHQRHHMPETRKSQHVYLRPDLGTQIMKFQDLHKHMEGLGLNPAIHLGKSPSTVMPKMTVKLKRHLEKYFLWDMQQDCEVL